MTEPLKLLKATAAGWVQALPPGDFARELRSELHTARRAFFDEPLILALQEEILAFIYDDFGFGVQYAKETAITAGALMLAQAAEETDEQAAAQRRRLALLAQAAGLLHHVVRFEPEHWARSAEIAQQILSGLDMRLGEPELVAQAITAAAPGAARPQGLAAALLSDALHDAAAMRLGPDILAAVLWSCCDYEDWPLTQVAESFAAEVARCTDPANAPTFRTEIGRRHGPAILALGRELGPRLVRELSELAASHPDSLTGSSRVEAH